MNNYVPSLSAEQLNLVLSLSKTATAVHVGENATIEFANDAMLSIWGKSESVIGKSLEQALPELKDQPFLEMFARVWNEGLTLSGTDTAADLKINEETKTYYFDFEYRAVKDSSGKVIAILHTAVDVTDRVMGKKAVLDAAVHKLNLEREQALNEELAASNEELNATIEELSQSQDELSLLNNELEDRIAVRVKDLTESEERFRNMAEASDILIAVGDENSQVTYFNKAWTTLTGRSMDQLLTSGWAGLIHPDDRDSSMNTYLSAYEKQISFTGEFRILSADGTYHWLLAKAPPRFRPDGTFAGYISSCIDITDRKLEELDRLRLSDNLAAINEEMVAINEEMASTNEELLASNQHLVAAQELLGTALEKLTQSETKLRYLILNAPIAIALLSGREMIIDTANQEVLRIWGKDTGVIGKTIIEALPEIVGQPFPKLLDEVFTSGVPFVGKETMALLEDQQVYVNFVYQPLVNDGGEVDSILITATDVTELVLSRNKVEEAENALRIAIEAAKFGTWYIHSETRELIASDRLKELFGFYPHEQLTIADAIGQITPDFRQYAIDTLEEAITGGGNYDVTYSVIGLHDNNLRWLRAVGKLQKDKSGEFSAFTGVVMDITAPYLAARKTERAEESLRMAIDAAELGSYYINVNDRIFVASPKLKEFFGFYPEDEVPYEAAIGQIHKDYRQAVADLVEAAITKGTRFDMEYPVVGFRDGKIRWVRGIGVVQHENNGIDSYFTGVLHEITERKMDEIRKNDFIGMVSHELKTPLTSLTGYIQIMRRKAEKSKDQFLIGALDIAARQVKKMANMINGFLNISRLESGKIVLDKSEFDVHELISETLEDSVHFDSTHHISYDSYGAIKVFADRDKIGNVISNFLSNAIKYSPADTSVIIKCELTGDMVRVSVTDQGHGLKEKDLEKIFERYYRVDEKSHVSGFGIGLYLSAEIIERHDGKIWAESKYGSGSKFFFTIPVKAEPY